MPEKQSEQEDELLLDTSKMTEGQKEAMIVAESARQKEYTQPSFAKQLFMGTFDQEMLFPFPKASAEDKAVGDAFLEKLEVILKEMDPEEVDRSRQIPQEVMRKLGELGAFAMKVPKEYNGLGFSQYNYNRVIQLVGSYCGSTAVLLTAHQSIGVPQPLKMFGTEQQKKKFLPRFREGAISAFALTEPNVGSDPAQMTATAELSDDGSHYIINGEKLWCTNGPIADVIVIMVKTKPKIVKGKERQQISALLVEMNSPGVEVLHRCDFMGLKAIHNGLLKFTNVKVPAENLLWGEGRGLALALATLNVGRLTVPAACAGMAKQCLSLARRWGNRRKQWGQPIGYHEAGRQKVAFIASHAFAMEAVATLGAHLSDEGKVDIRIEAAFGKLFTSEYAQQLADQTLQFRGGRGYETATSLKARGEDDPYPVERMVRDTRINTIIEGTSDIMRLFLAREAIDPHLTLAGDLLKKSTSVGQKLSALLKMVGFYATWYPKQWINGSAFSSYSDLGKLGKHYNFIERNAHKLSRKIFHSMAKHQQGLESQQVLLGHLTDIGMELYAMTATCSYAIQQQEELGGDKSPLELADTFCALARRRIKEHFAALSDNDTSTTNKLAEAVLKGKARWMEKGIIWAGPNE